MTFTFIVIFIVICENFYVIIFFIDLLSFG